MKHLILILMSLMFVYTVFAAEQIDLTVPVTITSYKVVELHLDVRAQEIRIVLHNATSNKDLVVTYTGATASALMAQMNKMNFSTNSMQKVILNKLITDGKVVGTVSGAPD